ncbi:MAG: hypothetical protein ACOC2L_04690, partial [Candidatus Sumerlaeota bacterium]
PRNETRSRRLCQAAASVSSRGFSNKSSPAPYCRFDKDIKNIAILPANFAENDLWNPFSQDLLQPKPLGPGRFFLACGRFLMHNGNKLKHEHYDRRKEMV